VSASPILALCILMLVGFAAFGFTGLWCVERLFLGRVYLRGFRASDEIGDGRSGAFERRGVACMRQSCF
jgi:hypothetical protein